ncbi:MAG: Rpn family recombination-promoting nuclease/putative transposase [Myxococcota bacterium]
MSALRLLDPKLDLVFKMLLGRPENRQLLISFVSAVLGLAITSVEVLDPELPKEAVEDKGVVLDIRARLADGSQVDVEMQSRARPGRRERTLYHWSRIFSSQLVRGEQYQNLRNCYVIFILDFLEFATQHFHSIFRVREIEGNFDFCPHLELHFLELPKLASAPVRKQERLLRGWAKFLTASTEVELEELAMTDPIFRQAKSALESMSADAKARLMAERREAELLFREYEVNLVRREGRVEGRAEGRVEGRAEGRVEGRAEGRAEVLLEQLAERFGELPTSVHERVQHASLDELRIWSRRVLSASSIEAVFAA